MRPVVGPGRALPDKTRTDGTPLVDSCDRLDVELPDDGGTWRQPRLMHAGGRIGSWAHLRRPVYDFDRAAAFFLG
jgi:hypothetical protein